MNPSDEALDRGHETAGLSPVGLLFGVTAVASMILVALAVSWLTVTAFNDFVPVSKSAVFPAPGVEPNQAFDRRRLEKARRQELSSYGWADRDAGVATIPIERAMALMKEEDLAGLGRDGGDGRDERNEQDEPAGGETPAP